MSDSRRTRGSQWAESSDSQTTTQRTLAYNSSLLSLFRMMDDASVKIEKWRTDVGKIHKLESHPHLRIIMGGKAAKRTRPASPTPSVATSTTGTPAPDDARPPAKRGRVTTLEDMRLAFLERYDPNKWTAPEILVAQMNGWRSDVYKHFKTPPTIVEVDGEVRYKFICAKAS
ncbi:hypothetical protein BD410DRAFT_845818 [Rickenella mellea]|uniref:Uncharacterized protein n=1 Tax=Rickenella mellea TaxID=50990 RepID=A0A4Y7PHE5_9AGAM|nr:hypothetical protein BD410DRAFT_845818 [Rickenella mellea]